MDDIPYYPQLNAAASLKQFDRSGYGYYIWSVLSAAKCCGLIEAVLILGRSVLLLILSAAKCCGLIEARPKPPSKPQGAYYPQLNAAASLKQSRQYARDKKYRRLSAAKCCGLIEAAIRMFLDFFMSYYPQLNAAASLKPRMTRDYRLFEKLLSAAKCCGLIEAERIWNFLSPYN